VSGWRGGGGMGSAGRGGGWCARSPRGGASWAREWLERPIDVDGLGNALSDGLKRNDSGATLVASRPKRGGTAWLQASARQDLRGGEEEQGELRRPARRDDSGVRVAARWQSARRDGTAHGESLAKVRRGSTPAQ
jgi:hypothetical protein